ncbi:MAG: hypothetical protein JWM19_2596 [Actinomycetia bacterium]|nr:hypothetical protein [Actinomycetes bacterium]
MRRLRTRAGMTQTQLAAAALSSKSTISNVENGITTVKLDLITRVDQALEADGWLIEIWSLSSSGSFSSAAIAEAEKKAKCICDWEFRNVPGLLQTLDYMRAFMRAGRATPEQIDKESGIRLNRQQVAFSPTLDSAWFVIDESVFYRPYGGREAMREQLIRLEQATELPNVFIQIMPYGATNHPGGEGPLRVIEYSDKPAIWYTEGWYSGRLTDDKDEVSAAVTNFNIIRASAMPPGESASFVATVRGSRYE